MSYSKNMAAFPYHFIKQKTLISEECGFVYFTFYFTYLDINQSSE